jgi:anti-sigma factor RsiW
MREHPLDQIPFYAAGTLSDGSSAALEVHLSVCPACRSELANWEQIARAMQEASAAGELPTLSTWVRHSLRRRPSLRESFQAAAGMVWAQRAVLLRGAVLPAVVMAIAAGVLAAILLGGFSQVSPQLYAVIPLFFLVPLIAILAVAYLQSSDTDPAFEILAATSTSPGTLVSARLTLALGVIGLLALIGSLVIGGFAGASLRWLIGAWLGPLLLLSALTTILALVWNPQIAIGVSLTLWSGVVVLALAALQRPFPWRFSPLFLLQPGWEILVAQIFLAGLLWYAAVRLLQRGLPVSRRLEAGE